MSKRPAEGWPERRCIHCGQPRGKRGGTLECVSCRPLLKVKPWRQRRNALLSGQLGQLTEEQWAAILVAYNHRCAYCLKRATQLQREHVVPISRTGTNVAANVVPACWDCNKRKGKKSGEEFGYVPPLRLLL